MLVVQSLYLHVDHSTMINNLAQPMQSVHALYSCKCLLEASIPIIIYTRMDFQNNLRLLLIWVSINLLAVRLSLVLDLFNAVGRFVSY